MVLLVSVPAGLQALFGQAERLGKSPEDALQQAWEIYTDTSPFPAVCATIR